MRRTAILVAAVLSCTSCLAQETSKRPVILGISQVQFYSTNMDASRGFYSSIFGSDPTRKNGCEWDNISQSIDGNETNFREACAEQNLRLVKPPKSPSANFLYEVAFVTDDLKALKGYLHTKNISIERSGQHYFAIRDPEGNRIGFFQSSRSMTPSPSGYMRIMHAGFVVRDKAAAEHFYKDILGFRPYWHGGMKDDQTDWESLQVPDGTDWVEFMVNVPADADQRLRGIMNHIALGVPDIHEAAKQLLKNGMKLTEEPKIGRDGKWQLNLYDPDQTRVELMEFTPVEKPCCSEYTGPHPKP